MITLLLPDFLLILLGYALRRSSFRDDGFWQGMEQFIYYVLFPPLLFNAVSRAPLDMVQSGPMLLAGLLFTLGGLLLGYAARWLMQATPAALNSGTQCAYRFNTYVGLAIIGGLHGQQGIAAFAVLVGLLIPLVNLVAILQLTQGQGQRIWRELLSNPLILAIALGLCWNLNEWSLPTWLHHGLGLLAGAALPLGLMTVGGALRLAAWRGAPWLVAWWSVVKLLLLPLLAVASCRLLGVTGVYYQAALVLACLPSATTAYILAVRLGSDGQLVAATITATTLGAMLTVPLNLALWG
ncbi:AEC family transporter [Chitinimonas sp. JJ19]|uniref:AEC family transporter n=1 Tax=Chitinimonas sp. JJ19 TaxID=3109352 RepID=UPI003002920F